jgi:translation elongation factor EF-G
VLNSVKNKKERIGRMLEMNANDRTDIDQARDQPYPQPYP